MVLLKKKSQKKDMKLLRNLPVHKPKGRKGRSRLVSKKKKLETFFFLRKNY
jgi:hypothetical protein